MPHEIGDATDDSPGAGQEVDGTSADGNLPCGKQNGDKQYWAESNAQVHRLQPLSVSALLSVNILKSPMQIFVSRSQIRAWQGEQMRWQVCGLRKLPELSITLYCLGFRLLDISLMRLFFSIHFKIESYIDLKVVGRHGASELCVNHFGS